METRMKPEVKKDNETEFNYEAAMERQRELAKREKISIVFYNDGNVNYDGTRSNKDMANDLSHCFVLAGSKAMNPNEIEDFFQTANDMLNYEYHVSAESCITFLWEKLSEKTGYSYAFEQGIWICDNTSQDLLDVDTGACCLAEAIAVWMLMQLGEYLEDYEEIKAIFDKNCGEIDRVLRVSLIEEKLKKRDF